MSLLQACDITGRNAVSCLIDGITNLTIQTGRCATPEELPHEYLSTLANEGPETSIVTFKRTDKRCLQQKLIPQREGSLKKEVRQNFKCLTVAIHRIMPPSAQHSAKCAHFAIDRVMMLLRVAVW